MPMSIPDLTRLHESTLRAMNLRNYLRRREQQQESDLAQTRAELVHVDTVYRQLQDKCEAEATPRLSEVK